MSAIVLRLALFAMVGIAGWIIGGTVGVFAGIGLDLLLLSDQPSGPGATVAAFAWGTGVIGAVAGMVAGFMWLGVRLGRHNEHALRLPAVAVPVVIGLALLVGRPSPSAALERVLADGETSAVDAIAAAGITATRVCVRSLLDRGRSRRRSGLCMG